MYFRTCWFVIVLGVSQTYGQQKVKVVPTGLSCGNGNGQIVYIVDTTPQTNRFLEICYNQNTGNVFYTKHVVPPNIFRLPEPSFKSVGLTFDPTDKYKVETEIQAFRQILGTISSSYISNTKGGPYLARGHLSPDADFSSYDRICSYYYINAVPQWQSINTGNWKSVENRVRKAAQAYGDLTVVTGTHEILSLPDDKNQLKNINLVPGTAQLPVPKYIWKVIYDGSNNGIAFINVNNPYLANTQGLLGCTNICSQLGWHKPEWDILAKGYTYCCEVKQFKALVTTAPDFSFITGILRAP